MSTTQATSPSEDQIARSPGAQNNVDADEIAKFERLASRWWDMHGEFKPLHDINPLRANYIDGTTPVAGQRVLDVGCGGGILSEALALRGAKICGIDMGEAPLEVAKLHRLESNLTIDYQHLRAEDLAESVIAGDIAPFDIVCCMEMLEHVPDPTQTLRACADILKPGGTLYFSTINRTAKAYAFAIIGAEYVLKMLPKGTHDYNKFIRPSELGCGLRQAHLQLLNLKGMTYNPLTKTYALSDKDLAVNYLGCAQKPEA